MVRIGNCSGFYGDRLTAMREMLEGGELDYLTGDYLAELTLLILGKDQLKDSSLGYARTFVAQVADTLALALEKKVRIVANAGGLNPAGLATKLTEVAASLGLDARIAYVDGDNLAPRAAELGLGNALTANAYLGAFGIARALEAGADIVVTGRVTDASVVVGPAIAHHGWTPTSYDELAGAVVAGHIIECGTQATGGNFSGFLDLPRSAEPLGFPLAEVAADGSFVVTKHAGTGGLVSVDTVTAQLVYEIQTTRYLGPDVITDLSSIQLAEDGADRVRVSGVTGTPPPATLKVCVNELGGFRNQMEFVLTGLDIDAKAAWIRTQLEARLAVSPPAEVHWSLGSRPAPDADTEEGASCLLRVTVKDPSADAVGKPFTAAAVELALASYPGFTMTAPPGRGSPYGIYRPAYVDRAEVTETVHLWDGTTVAIAPPPDVAAPDVAAPDVEPVETPPDVEPVETPAADAPTSIHPLGTFVHARSGDKGGDANVGLWIGGERGELRDRRIGWLLHLITPDAIKQLLPEAADLAVEVYPLPNLGGVNVLIRGLLGDGVAASTRFDPQAKAVGEWLRSRHVHVPEELL
ncbi:acyclic terpene utilization AtuA family protein [Nocardioides marmoriginsengisoli]|uniref:Acyclic terpene utilization AtuA family protein n=1 Tax=Nocardioides marmoriginsengisoli TaxID=661483 RepID=A0A3N0CIR3_9ACTN|nr:acyclic terpene utilization AtuA family protein [Nocardioides marmoriginsengisoli]